MQSNYGHPVGTRWLQAFHTLALQSVSSPSPPKENVQTTRLFIFSFLLKRQTPAQTAPLPTQRQPPTRSKPSAQADRQRHLTAADRTNLLAGRLKKRNLKKISIKSHRGDSRRDFAVILLNAFQSTRVPPGGLEEESSPTGGTCLKIEQQQSWKKFRNYWRKETKWASTWTDAPSSSSAPSVMRVQKCRHCAGDPPPLLVPPGTNWPCGFCPPPAD